MENSKYVIGVRDFNGTSYVEYDAYIQLANHTSIECEQYRNEIKCLQKECEELKEQSFRDNDCLEKFQKDFIRFNEKNKALQDENNALKAEIQRLMGQCGEVPADTEKKCASDDTPDYKELCRKLQDQHQQDCILINNLNVTIDKLVDRYANLRKNVGMD